MERGVFMFPLPCILDRAYSAEYPRGMELLKVVVHKGYPKVLGKLDPSKAGKELHKRHFMLVKTGEIFDDSNVSYIDSFSLPNFAQPLHLFEIIYGGSVQDEVLAEAK